ncbi:tRNA methyltransferase subunit 11-2 [Arctopsyche grandis]|uniref:tRNA methyltransferase subunit 11-2 n=1 Tax=Arctopsyche grandis TaxID=121162 RepID=UPI00406D8AA7
MKLVTHNMLTSKCVKGVVNGYPLGITATDCRLVDVDFNPDFIARMIPKIDWNVLWSAVDTLGHSEGLPKDIVENYEDDQVFLRKAHRALMEIEVLEGTLTCPETGRQFPIARGIPNMLLTEAEV